MRKLILLFLLLCCGNSWAITTSGINSQTLSSLSVANHDKIYVDSSGSVGIGTKTLDNRVTIQSTVNIDTGVSILNQSTGGAAYSSLYIANSDGQGFELAVQGSSNTDQWMGESAAGKALFFCSGNPNGMIIETDTANASIQIGTNDTEAIKIKGTNQYVGINTTDPQYRLSVNGNFGVTGNIYESNSAYGGFFVSGNTTATVISSTTTLYDVTKNAQSMGLLKNITHSAGVVTVGVAGIYMVTVVGNIDQKTAADDIHCFISKNNTNTPSWEYISDSLDSTIATQPIMCQGIFSLAANDTLRLKVQNVTGARNVRIENLNFMVRRIAP